MPQVIRSFFSPITERSVGAGVPARLRRLSLRLSPHAFYRAFLPHAFYCMPFVAYFQWICRFRWIAMQLSPHSVVMRQLQHSYWKNGEHSAPPWFLNWTHLKRAYIIPQKNQNQRFFPPNIASPSSSFQKKHSAKIAIKVLHGYFPFKRSTFPAKQKTAQAQNLGFPEAPAKILEIYVDPRRRHIVYYKTLKRRDDRVADCAWLEIRCAGNRTGGSNPSLSV